MKKVLLLILLFFLYSLKSVSAQPLLEIQSRHSLSNEKLYHFNEEICKPGYYQAVNLSNIEKFKEDEKNNCQVDLLEAILHIPGIVEIDPKKRFRIKIEKGKLFSWINIEKVLIKISKKHFKAEVVSFTID